MDSTPTNGDDWLTYDETAGVYRATCKPETSPTQGVVAAIGLITETDATDMEPLYTVVDTTALDALLDGAAGDEDVEPISVRFTYHEYEITVDSTGEMVLRPRNDTPTA